MKLLVGLLALNAFSQTVGPSSGITCYSNTISYTAFKTAAGANFKDIFLMNWQPKYRPLHIFIWEKDLFAAKNSGVSYYYSAGRISSPDEVIPLNRMGLLYNSWFDRIGVIVVPALGFQALYLHFVAKDTSGNNLPLGDGFEAEMTKGSLTWEVCGFTVPN